MRKLRIVVADRTTAIFYEAPSLRKVPLEVGRLNYLPGNLQERELGRDRPGRGHTSVTGIRYGMDTEDKEKHKETLLFAKLIVRRLEQERQAGAFEALIIVAGPAFLGVLRETLPRSLRLRVIHEIHKDLTHSSIKLLQRHLPEYIGDAA
jgi:protein required for attachment to host cells